MNEIQQKIKAIMEKELSGSAHSMDHVMRVHDLCMHLADAEMAARAESKRTEIADGEKDVDKDVLEASVLLHDIARVKEAGDNTGNTDHAVLGSVMSEKILKELNFPPEKIEKVKHSIACHRFRTGNEPKTIEAKILFDADKLDTLGAVGIARLFMVAGEHGEKIYVDTPIEEYISDNLVGGKPNGRIKNPSKHSPNLDFVTKVIHIPDKLYTQKAKEIAKERMGFMQEFFERLKNEVHGKR
ncbi:MAG: HD domain-containing protein [Nanoarchaeota archaeon]|nr:HD domain-containing protein [Nanoarchaeota archaeon]MBU4300707.1 HD domain-containing protein [Nanoarchaeota archaeon]MBU4451780.1 HD domain-containing protein [Nanoarchaeota archaeon]MCG2723491.1 HD domain-containing protein [archaeon]